jgi:hypothetical protein
MGQFKRDFAELLKMDAARKGAKPAVTSKLVTPPDEDDDDDMADIDAQIFRASRRYRRGRDPCNLTANHVELARRLADGQPPFTCAKVAPLNYNRRAVRSLIATPAWQAVFNQLRHDRSPTIDQLIEATKTRDPGVQPSVPFTQQPGYTIRLKPQQ